MTCNLDSNLRTLNDSISANSNEDGWMDGTLYFNTAFYQIKIYSNIKIWFT